MYWIGIKKNSKRIVKNKPKKKDGFIIGYGPFHYSRAIWWLDMMKRNNLEPPNKTIINQKKLEDLA